MDKILMKCGHIANGITKDKKPICVICNCKEKKEEEYNLKGRRALCNECGRTVPSSTKLAFFRYKPNQPYDSYYCGCKGWD